LSALERALPNRPVLKLTHLLRWALAEKKKKIVSRVGCGKVKHLEARQLWIQEAVRRKVLVVKKVGREINIADALTHHWASADGLKHFTKAGLAWRQRR